MIFAAASGSRCDAHVRAAAIACLLAPAATSAQGEPSPEAIVDAFNAVSGKHPNTRASGAKGVCVAGTFTPAADAAGLSLRLSDEVGDMVLVMISAPVFGTRTPQQLMASLVAREPGAGQLGLTDDEVKAKPDSFYADELNDRLGRGPAAFDLVAILGQPGDPTADITTAWPEESRQTVRLGTVSTAALAADATCDASTFDPVDLPNGVAGPADDPMFRSAPRPTPSRCRAACSSPGATGRSSWGTALDWISFRLDGGHS